MSRNIVKFDWRGRRSVHCMGVNDELPDLSEILEGLTDRQKDRVLEWMTEFKLSLPESVAWRRDRECFVKSVYLGVTLQPALGLTEHVSQLLARTATAIVCLGDLQRIPLSLAMRIFSVKLMPIIRYGMSNIAPKLAKTSMEDPDKSKKLFLKPRSGSASTCRTLSC